jgi:hypothetical protein
VAHDPPPRERRRALFLLVSCASPAVQLRRDVRSLEETLARTENFLREREALHERERSELRAEMAANVAHERGQAALQRRAMGTEVMRLRRVHDKVLEQSGADALVRGANGPRARSLLYYESMKSRTLLQPAGSLTWRGQQDRPSSERGMQTEPERRRTASPPHSRSGSPERALDSAPLDGQVDGGP